MQGDIARQAGRWPSSAIQRHRALGRGVGRTTGSQCVVHVLCIYLLVDV